MAHVLGEWYRTGQLTARHDVWITSKILNPRNTSIMFKLNRFCNLPQMTPEQVARMTEDHFERVLLELNLGYIDLMLLHWPAAGPGEGTETLNRQQRLAAWRVLETMYEKGWCRAIGVSNYAVKHLQQLMEDGAKIKPMVNQIEASVEVQHVNIREYCKQQGIVPQAYSVLRGLSFSTSLTKASSSSTLTTTTEPSSLSSSTTSTTQTTLESLAAKYQKDVGQIAFRYLIQHGYAIIYLTHSEHRMVSNTNVFDFELTHDEMTTIDTLNKPTGGWGLPKPDELNLKKKG